jgi:hypothetical protein
MNDDFVENILERFVARVFALLLSFLYNIGPSLKIILKIRRGDNVIIQRNISGSSKISITAKASLNYHLVSK